MCGWCPLPENIKIWKLNHREGGPLTVKGKIHTKLGHCVGVAVVKHQRKKFPLNEVNVGGGGRHSLSTNNKAKGAWVVH